MTPQSSTNSLQLPQACQVEQVTVRLDDGRLVIRTPDQVHVIEHPAGGARP